MIYLPLGHPSVERLNNLGYDICEGRCDKDARKIIILNLMPQKQEAEEEYYMMLDGAGIDIEITLAKMSGLTYKTTPQEYMDMFYTDIAEIMESQIVYDGLIVTGAPVEHIDYKQVTYWEQMYGLYRWTFGYVRSTLNVCWGALAALKIFFGIEKHLTDGKLFGIFAHKVLDRSSRLLCGMPDEIMIPISRHATLFLKELQAEPQLTILLDQEETGPELAIAWDGRHIFANGHLEYAEGRLKFEYERDLAKAKEIQIPKNYFVDNNPAKGVVESWRKWGKVYYHNWLRGYVCNDELRVEPLNIEFRA